MDKKTYWKDGYQLIDNSGLVYTVKGKCASCRKLGKNPDGSIEEEEYDDDLKLIHRWGRGDKYYIIRNLEARLQIRQRATPRTRSG